MRVLSGVLSGIVHGEETPERRFAVASPNAGLQSLNLELCRQPSPLIYGALGIQLSGLIVADMTEGRSKVEI